MNKRISILAILLLSLLSCQKDKYELPEIINPENIPELFTPDEPYRVKRGDVLTISPAIRYSDMDDLSYEWHIEDEVVSTKKTLVWECTSFGGSFDGMLAVRVNKLSIVKEFKFTIIVEESEAKPEFSKVRYISFDTDQAPFEILYNFEPVGNKTETIKIPIRYSGHLYDSDKTFSLRICKDMTTAIENEDFVLPDQNSLIFHSIANFRDYTTITLKSTQRSKNKDLTICLELKDNENFKVGGGISKLTIIVSNKIHRPDWWNNDVTVCYLGEYSDKKYKLFAQNIFPGNFGALDPANKRMYQLQFKNWIAQHPDIAIEKDGSLMQLP